MSCAITIDRGSQNAPTQHNNPAYISEEGESFQNDLTHQIGPADGSDWDESSQGDPAQQNNPAGGSELVRFYCRGNFWIFAVRIFVFLMSEPFVP